MEHLKLYEEFTEDWIDEEETDVYPPDNDPFREKIFKHLKGTDRDKKVSTIKYLRNVRYGGFKNFNDFKSIITTMIDVAEYEVFYFDEIVLLIINTYWNAAQGNLNFTEKQIKDFLVYLFVEHIPLELKFSFLGRLYWTLKKNRTSDTELPYPFPINLEELNKIVDDIGGWEYIEQNATPLRNRIPW